MTKTSTNPTSPTMQKLYDGIPLLQTCIVRDGTLPVDLDSRPCFTGPEDVAAFLKPYFATKDREEFVVVFLDTSNGITGMHVASVGGLAASIVEPRQVFKAAILANAAAIICAHNHPSGNPEPSKADIQVTRQLVESGKLLGIPVHDHLIIAERAPCGFTSLAERGLL